MNKNDKIQEGQVQLDDRQNYTLLEAPMAQETSQKVQEIINNLHEGGHIDTMTKKWLSQTPCLPRIPLFYTLTKFHEPTLIGRPINSGCDAAQQSEYHHS